MKKIAKVLVGLFVIMVLLSMCSAWGDDDESSEEQTTETVQETKKTAKKKNVKKQKATTESTEAEVEKLSTEQITKLIKSLYKGERLDSDDAEKMRASGEEAFLIPWEDMLYSKVFEDGEDWSEEKSTEFTKIVKVYSDFWGGTKKIDDLISNQKVLDQCLTDRESIDTSKYGFDIEGGTLDNGDFFVSQRLSDNSILGKLEKSLEDANSGPSSNWVAYRELKELGYETNKQISSFFNRRIECILDTQLSDTKTYERMFFENEYIDKADADTNIKELMKRLSNLEERKRSLEKRAERYEEDIAKLEKNMDIKSAEQLSKKRENKKKNSEEMYKLDLKIIKLKEEERFDENDKIFKNIQLEKELNLEPKYYYIPLNGYIELSEDDKAFFRQILKMFKKTDDLENLENIRWEKYDYEEREKLFQIISKIKIENYVYLENKNGKISNPRLKGEYHIDELEERILTELDRLEEKILFPHLYRISIKLRRLYLDIGEYENSRDANIRTENVEFEKAFDKYLNIWAKRRYSKTFNGRMNQKIRDMQRFCALIPNKSKNRKYKFEECVEFEETLDRYLNLTYKDERSKYDKRIKYKIEKFEKMFTYYQKETKRIPEDKRAKIKGAVKPRAEICNILVESNKEKYYKMREIVQKDYTEDDLFEEALNNYLIRILEDYENINGMEERERQRLLEQNAEYERKYRLN